LLRTKDIARTIEDIPESVSRLYGAQNQSSIN
jgi:hypothetical protein